MGAVVRTVAPPHISPLRLQFFQKLLCSSWLLQLLEQFNWGGLRGAARSPQPPPPAPLPWSRCFLSLCLLTVLRLFGSLPSLNGCGFLIQPLPSGLSRPHTHQQMDSWEMVKNAPPPPPSKWQAKPFLYLLSRRRPRQDWGETLKWALHGFSSGAWSVTLCGCCRPPWKPVMYAFPQQPGCFVLANEIM